jgi:hypothetical protein
MHNCRSLDEAAARAGSTLVRAGLRVEDLFEVEIKTRYLACSPVWLFLGLKSMLEGPDKPIYHKTKTDNQQKEVRRELR